MRFHHAALVLPLIVIHSSCSAPPDPDPGAPPATAAADASGTSPGAGASDRVPRQIAQYPGAPLEDRQGHLWFGTVLEGLVRYDGTDFESFTTADGLGGDMIRGMVEDADGVLWIATNGGLSRYDGVSFTTLTDYEPLTVTRGWSEHGNHRDLWDVVIDRRGDLWIATMDGVFRLDGQTFVRFPLPVVAPRPTSEFTPKMVYCIHEDRAGHLWFGTDGAGAVRYDGDAMTVYTVASHGLSSDNVCAILQDRRGDHWFGTSKGGVSRFDGSDFTTHLRTKERSRHAGWGRYMAILEDRDGSVWFGASHAGGGVYRFDGTSFEHLSESAGLGGGGVPSIRADRDGTLWFGTTAGVYHFDGARFVNFSRDDPRVPVPIAPANGAPARQEPGDGSLDG